jgi:hypothetical protein
VLSKFPQWESTYSNTTCFSCIARGPDNTLSCRHTLCDPCIIVHGRTTLEEPWNFILETCPFCNFPNKVNFILKPYTAGTKCLSIDGGSLQDIMSLKVLENELKLPMPIRDHFDIGTGSGLGLSSPGVRKQRLILLIGALLVLQIFCKEWSIDDCLRNFQVTNTFGNTPESRFSQDSTSVNHQRNKYLPFSRVHTRLREALSPTSNQLSSSTINSNLKSIFGKDKTLFECSGNGTKIAVTATRSKDSSTCIFSNYNGPEKRPGGHTLIRPEKPRDEMLIWHM